jgi:dolichol-phosphate mannosyltransferase
VTPSEACDISVVVPVYNEQENIVPLVHATLDALRPLKQTFEIILADDCSTDETPARIEAASREAPNVRGVHLPRHAGQSAAMLAAFSQARGRVVVTMDGDLQNDPADIPKLLERLSGCDAVCGYRARRQDRWSRRVASRLANRIRNLVTRDGMRDTGCSLKAFSRACVADLPPLQGVHRFMPAYFKLHGRKVEQIPVNHRPRQHGRSKYTNLKRLPTTVLDLVGFWWYRRRLIAEP